MATTIKSLLDKIDTEKAKAIQMNLTGVKTRELEKVIPENNVHLLLMLFFILSDLTDAQISNAAESLMTLYWKILEGDLSTEEFIKQLQEQSNNAVFQESQHYLQIVAIRSAEYAEILYPLFTLNNAQFQAQLALLRMTQNASLIQLAQLFETTNDLLATIKAEQQNKVALSTGAFPPPPPPPPPPEGAFPPPPPPPPPGSKSASASAHKTEASNGTTSNENNSSPPADDPQKRMADELKQMLEGGGRGSLKKTKNKRLSMMPTADEMAAIMQQQMRDEAEEERQQHQPQHTKAQPLAKPSPLKQKTSSNGGSFQGIPKERSPLELQKELQRLKKELRTVSAERDALQEEVNELKKSKPTSNTSSLWHHRDEHTNGDRATTKLITFTTDV